MNVEHDDAGFVIFRNRWAEEETGAGPRTDRQWLDHIRARELAERAAAKRAACPRARHVHQQLAQAYSRIIRREGGQ